MRVKNINIDIKNTLLLFLKSASFSAELSAKYCELWLLCLLKKENQLEFDIVFSETSS
jgi:hypothetical protein